jgi:hypothetical protein
MKKHFKTYTVWYILILFLLLAVALWGHFEAEIQKIEQDIKSYKNQ